MRDKHMEQITIPLDDVSATRLRALANARGESVEQTAQALLLSTLPPVTPTSPPASGMPGLSPDDPDGSRLLLSLAGSLTWPGSTGTVHITNEEIDCLLAEAVMHPQEDA
jgi:hypothetical protein